MADRLGSMVSDISRLMRRRFDARARTIGVTRPQWRVLAALMRHEGLNQGGLAEILEVEPITLCRMIDRLEDAGLVERRRDPADRRAWRIFLTEKSQPMLEQLQAMADELMGEALKGVSRADEQHVMRTLEAIRANLHRDEDKKDEAASG